eukprot:CAMPEP_0118929156 /NCGR_PEP_ID=MMETSP1169-20130426/6238_1 /TAXON_ID=36882 /ORGANISM="Pyramimonas obovata, Strain CCMP722" /LENGTH=54 /DNA_ID=CAMNT_0006871291 /DNA_START=329 /DNA_END=490 /DNA_ORIENTATION=-
MTFAASHQPPYGTISHPPLAGTSVDRLWELQELHVVAQRDLVLQTLEGVLDAEA